MAAKTLLILAHPSLESSGANRVLIESIRGAQDVEIRDLYALYPAGNIDVQAEQEAISGASRLVFQYPTYWYSTPPLLKQWLDEVLEYGWAYGTQFALEGKSLQVVTTAGAPAESYTPLEENRNGYGVTMDEILSPVRTTARYLKMQWTQPLVVFKATAETARDMIPSYRAAVTGVL